MKKILLITCVFIFLICLLTGCGDDSSTLPTVGTGSIIVKHETLSVELSKIDQIRFTGLDYSGNTVYGPFIIEASQVLSALQPGEYLTGQEREYGMYRLENVPAHISHLLTEYLISGTSFASSRVPVNIPNSGETTVTYPGDSKSPVHLAHSAHSQTPWTLICDGQPLFIKGVGFDYSAPGNDWSSGDFSSGNWFSYIDPDIGLSGANVIRTYGSPMSTLNVTQQTEIISYMLKYASKASTSGNKIWVLPGIFANGNDNSTTTEFVTTFVLNLQKDPNYDHLLGYIVGYEVDPGLFSYIDNLMAAAKTVMSSGNSRPLIHATWSVSGTDTNRISQLQAITNMDILGVDSYYGHFGNTAPLDSGLSTEYEDLKTAGWTGPFLVAEFFTYDWGSNIDPGMGQILNGGVNYLLEANSTERSADLENNWNNYIASQTAQQNGCLGGLALNWGPPHNSKFVGYWFAFYTYTGDFDSKNPYHNPPYTGNDTFNRLDLVHSLAKLYGGSLSTASSPKIVRGDDNDPQGISCGTDPNNPIKATASSQGVPQDGGAEISASVKAQSTDSLTFSWYLVGGTNTDASGNIIGFSQNPQAFAPVTTALIGGSQLSGSHVETSSNGITTSTVTFNLPVPEKSGNNYQLRVVISDTKNNAATAAIPIRMK